SFQRCRIEMSLPFPREAHFLEPSHAASDGNLCRQALDAGGAEEADDALGVVEDILRVLWLGNWPAMTENKDLLTDRLRPVGERLSAAGRLVESQGGPGADGALGGQAHVRDQHVGAGLCHVASLVLVEDIGAGEQTDLMSGADHLDLETETHAGFFEALAE